MIRTASAVVLALLVSNGSVALAQSSPPQAYTLKAAGAIGDRKMTVTILRDGARERVELAIEGAGGHSTLYDFEAKRVHWIGWSGAGSCSSGRYLSARAPVGEDPVTGSADNLVSLTKGRSRKAAGSGSVAGKAARIEAFVGGKRPKELDEPWPTRVWLAEEGGYLLKLEGEGPKGKPITLMEVTELIFARPSGAQLEPPADCIATNSEMDDAGSIRSSAQATIDVKASATADLGAGTSSATVTQTEGKGSKRTPAAPLAKLGAVTLRIAEQPHAEGCGTKLLLTATFTADGPATVHYRFVPSVGGLQFPHGQDGDVTMDEAGSATLARDASFPRSLKGQVRVQAMVMGTKGHNGPLKSSDPVPFQVTCAGK